MLQRMESQRVGHDLATEQQQLLEVTMRFPFMEEVTESGH